MVTNVDSRNMLKCSAQKVHLKVVTLKKRMCIIENIY